MDQAVNNRILIIDDNPDIHSDFRKILVPVQQSSELDELEAAMLGTKRETTHNSVTLFHAHQGEEGFKMVRDANARGEPFVAAFVDMRMPPGWDGLKTIHAIREIDKDITIVVCTAYSDHSWEEIAAKIKELDKLLILKKPFDPVEVQAFARSLIERCALLQQSRMRQDELETLVRDRTADLEHERSKDKLRLEELEVVIEARTTELRKLAMHDKLTGLPNRVLFYDRLMSAIERNRCDSTHAFAVMFIDFDRFKVINDSLGHPIGDLLLVAIGKRITEALAAFVRTPIARGLEPPVAARLGGDEFCILLEGPCSDGQIDAVADSLHEALLHPYDLAGRQVNSTASIGVTRSSFGYSTAEEVLRDADTAMYRAKSEGRNRFVMFDRSMHEQAMRRLILESDLRYAIERNELELFYQPIVSLSTGDVTGAESLLRWRHAKHGIISPTDFIPLSEETGDIDDIGRWVLTAACRQINTWSSGNLVRLPHISINVSRKQLSDPDLLASFERALTSTKINPHHLTVEITESALIKDADLAERTVNALRDLGLRVFVDDFGTGQSSLASLRRFNLDGLKLDRSFLDHSIFSRRTAAIIHSAITLARDLDMDLIAEGVESLEQVAILQTLGCEQAQGFLFARPTEASTIEAAVTHGRWVTPFNASTRSAA